MKEKHAYQATVFFSIVAVVLLVMNISLANVNRMKQADMAQRQSTIVSGQTLAQLNQALVKAMADASVKNDNLQIRDLLTAQGITLKNQSTSPVKK